MLIEIDSSDYSEMKAVINEVIYDDKAPEMILTLNFYRGDEVVCCVKIDCKGWVKMFDLPITLLHQVREAYENSCTFGAIKEDIGFVVVDGRKAKKTLSLVNSPKTDT